MLVKGLKLFIFHEYFCFLVNLIFIIDWCRVIVVIIQITF